MLFVETNRSRPMPKPWWHLRFSGLVKSSVSNAETNLLREHPTARMEVHSAKIIIAQTVMFFASVSIFSDIILWRSLRLRRRLPRCSHRPRYLSHLSHPVTPSPIFVRPFPCVPHPAPCLSNPVLCLYHSFSCSPFSMSHSVSCLFHSVPMCEEGKIWCPELTFWYNKK